jgi:hypothetical protein
LVQVDEQKGKWKPFEHTQKTSSESRGLHTFSPEDRFQLILSALDAKDDPPHLRTPPGQIRAKNVSVMAAEILAFDNVA